MNMRITTRERFLLIIAFVVFGGMGYYFFRWAPQHRTIVALQNETQEARRELQKQQQEFVKSDRSPMADIDPESIERELHKLNQEYQRTTEHLAELQGQFASVTNNQALQQLKVDITALANESNVIVLESVPRNEKPTAAAQNSTAAKHDTIGSIGPFISRDFFNELNGGRFYEFTMKSSFHSLEQFLQGLSELPWRVTVVQFDIQVNESKEQHDQQFLKTKLVLAL